MCLAIPGKVLSIAAVDDDPLSRTGRVEFGGIVKEVSLACVPEAKVGNYVLVHVGFALSIVDEQEARQVFEYLRQMDELADLKANRPVPAGIDAAPPSRADSVQPASPAA